MKRPDKDQGNPEPTSSDDFEALLAASSLGTDAARQIAATVPDGVRAHLATHVNRADPCGSCAAWQEPEDRAGHATTDALFLADIVAAASNGALLRGTAHPPGRGAVTSAPAITSTIPFRLVVSSESSLPVPTRLRYYLNDPFAVHAEFITGENETVEWIFSRSLLTGGVRQPAGKGDVRLWPSRSHGMPVICFALSSPEGEALLEAPRQQLVEFLRRTYRLVPIGSETVELELESFVEDIRAGNHEES